MRTGSGFLLAVASSLLLAVPSSAAAQGPPEGLKRQPRACDSKQRAGLLSLYDLYDFEKERVSIFYSSGPCTEGLEGSWNVPRETVIQISVAPKGKLLLSDLHLDLSKYERVKDPLIQVHTIYQNKEEGIRYEVFEGGGEDDGKILSTDYEPAAEDKDLRCKKGGDLPAPNNGMHPTADTNLVIYIQRPGAASDAGRWAASSEVRNEEFHLVSPVACMRRARHAVGVRGAPGNYSGRGEVRRRM